MAGFVEQALLKYVPLEFFVLRTESTARDAGAGMYRCKRKLHRLKSSWYSTIACVLTFRVQLDDDSLERPY